MKAIIDPSSSGPAVIIVNSVLAVIAAIAVGLRFWSRKLTGLGWATDDYFALIAFFLQTAIYGLSVHAVLYGGLGRDLTSVLADTPDATTVLLKVLFALCFIYGVVSPLIKLSVLCFYIRIFPTHSVKVGSYVIGSLCIGWFISITIVNSMQCKPISSFWNPVGDYKCIDLILYFVGNSGANCAIDILTLALPIREVLRLQVSLSKRAGLCGIFLLGSMVIVASLVRLISLCILYRTGVTNLTSQYVMMWIATCVEIWIAIIGGCLPTVVPAYRKVRYGSIGSAAATVSQGYPTPSGLKGSRSLSVSNKISPRHREHDLSEGSFERLHTGPDEFYGDQEGEDIVGKQISNSYSMPLQDIRHH